MSSKIKILKVLRVNELRQWRMTLVTFFFPGRFIMSQYYVTYSIISTDDPGKFPLMLVFGCDSPIVYVLFGTKLGSEKMRISNTWSLSNEWK